MVVQPGEEEGEEGPYCSLKLPEGNILSDKYFSKDSNFPVSMHSFSFPQPSFRKFYQLPGFTNST